MVYHCTVRICIAFYPLQVSDGIGFVILNVSAKLHLQHEYLEIISIRILTQTIRRICGLMMMMMMREREREKE